MAIFVKEQMDYIYFFYGLGFIILAAVCFALTRLHNQRLPWIWLGWFGLLHGASEWIELLHISLSLGPLAGSVHIYIMMLSFVCLVEFGRLGYRRLTNRGPGRWVILPLLLVSALGTLGDLRTVNISSRYVLASTGGFYSVAALYTAYKRAEQHQKLPLAAAAVVMLFYAFAASLIGPKAQFFPANMFNRDTFMMTFSIPVQLVRGLLAVGIATAIYIYFNRSLCADTKIGIRSTIGIYTGISVLAFVIAGWFVTHFIGKQADTIARQNLLSRTGIAAAALHLEDIARLTGSSSDVYSPAYQEIKHRLLIIRSCNPDCRFAYLMAKKNGKIIFLADAEPSGSSDYSPPGEVYEDATDSLVSCLEDGKARIEGPVEDNWGNWVSGLKGITSPQNGRVVALFGMDIDASDWQRTVARHRLFCIAIVLLLCILPTAFFVILVGKELARAQIAESEQQYRLLAENVSDVIWTMDMDQRFTYVSPSVERLLAYKPQEVALLSAEQLVSGKAYEAALQAVIDRLMNESSDKELQSHSLTLELELITKNKERVWTETQLSLLRGPDGQVTGVLGITRNIAERKNTEAHMRMQTSAINAAGDQIVITDARGTIEFVNASFERETGYQAHEVLGKKPAFLRSDKHPKSFYKSIWRTVLAGDTWHGEMTNRRKDGTLYIDDVTVTPVKGDDGSIEHYIAIMRDITDKKNYEKQLDHLAHHDILTSLPNRLLFSDRLTQRLAQARRKGSMLAVMFFDLDHFKVINDTLGHNIGDLLLKEVAERLTQTLREVDTIARMGGDEFTIILSDISEPQDAALVANRVLHVLSQQFNIEGHELFISTSIGISLFPADGSDVETLVKNADTAMYMAKAQGRNGYRMYTDDLNAALVERMNLEKCLRSAIEKDEMLIHYQPQMDIHTGRIIGVEALIRWQHPEFGLIPAARFITLAEETGLIVQMSETVLRNGCIQNKLWQDQGLRRVPISINISARQFLQTDLVGQVRDVLDQTGLPPEYLTLEITESTLMDNPDMSIVSLRVIKSMGVRIFIDNFGTGYSSLSYLKRFPIDGIKIDQSFIRNITNDPDDAEIASAAIAMAHRLKLKVVAEGVETLDQLELLRSLHCDEIQGYFVSKPLPPEEIPHILKEESDMLQAV